jgi:predicted HTH transcriptional regulator
MIRTPRTLKDIKKLTAAGESETLELKRSTGELREGIEALCGFANYRGGTVIFGVTPTGRIVGQQVAESTLHDVATAVRSDEARGVRTPAAGAIACPAQVGDAPCYRVGSV